MERNGQLVEWAHGEKQPYPYLVGKACAIDEDFPLMMNDQGNEDSLFGECAVAVLRHVVQSVMHQRRWVLRGWCCCRRLASIVDSRFCWLLLY
jgi:hypothetical protein